MRNNKSSLSGLMERTTNICSKCFEEDPTNYTIVHTAHFKAGPHVLKLAAGFKGGCLIINSWKFPSVFKPDLQPSKQLSRSIYIYYIEVPIRSTSASASRLAQLASVYG